VYVGALDLGHDAAQRRCIAVVVIDRVQAGRSAGRLVGLQAHRDVEFDVEWQAAPHQRRNI